MTKKETKLKNLVLSIMLFISFFVFSKNVNANPFSDYTLVVDQVGFDNEGYISYVTSPYFTIPYTLSLNNVSTTTTITSEVLLYDLTDNSNWEEVTPVHFNNLASRNYICTGNSYPCNMVLTVPFVNPSSDYSNFDYGLVFSSNFINSSSISLTDFIEEDHIYTYQLRFREDVTGGSNYSAYQPDGSVNNLFQFSWNRVVNPDCYNFVVPINYACDAIHYLFYPSNMETIRTTYQGIWYNLQGYPPLNYFVQIDNLVSEFASSTLYNEFEYPYYFEWLSGVDKNTNPIFIYIFTPFYNALVFIFYFMGIYYLYKRFKHIELG